MHTLTVHRDWATFAFTLPDPVIRHLITRLLEQPHTRTGDFVTFNAYSVRCIDLEGLSSVQGPLTPADEAKVVEVLKLIEPAQPAQRKRAPVSDEARVRARREKARRGDYVTIDKIARDLGRSARDLRQALRKLGVEKPVQGWSWPPSEAVIIRNKLSKRFKKPVADPLQVH